MFVIIVMLNLVACLLHKIPYFNLKKGNHKAFKRSLKDFIGQTPFSVDIITNLQVKLNKNPLWAFSKRDSYRDLMENMDHLILPFLILIERLLMGYQKHIKWAFLDESFTLMSYIM